MIWRKHERFRNSKSQNWKSFQVLHSPTLPLSTTYSEIDRIFEEFLRFLEIEFIMFFIDILVGFYMVPLLSRLVWFVVLWFGELIQEKVGRALWRWWIFGLKASRREVCVKNGEKHEKTYKNAIKNKMHTKKWFFRLEVQNQNLIAMHHVITSSRHHALLAGVLCTWTFPILLPYGWCVLAVLAVLSLSEDVEKSSICSISHVSWAAHLAALIHVSIHFKPHGSPHRFDAWGHYSDANVQKCAVQSLSVKEEIVCKQVEELGRIAWTERTWLKSCNWYLTVQTLLNSSTTNHCDPLHNECIRTVCLISSYIPHIIYI